ncbi:hypothetical protein B0H14DRAFT_3523809 [Mycena olivaceomarginata]|nr:hypothetical protein B0H14DRAFT_3523809 [Mycena olivaceomarginata]
MAGRNGLLLYVGALLWWGEAAGEKEKEALLGEWKVAVLDVVGVLERAKEAVGERGEPPSAVKKAPAKRKWIDTALLASEEKENEGSVRKSKRQKTAA